MNPIYQQALDGTLVSPTGGAAVSGVQVYNYLPLPVLVYFIDTSGYHQYLGKLNSNSNAPLGNTNVGDYYLFTSPSSGSFVSVIQIAVATTSYSVTPSTLTEPNDIGPIPQPSTSIYVPPNSPLVLVACGTNPPTPPSGTPPASASYVTREQYWNLQGDSYSLSPGETRTISYTVTSGKQRTSSEQADVSTSLGVSGSAGWGPVSASLSASLNMSASVFQQVTVTEETSTYVSDVVTNDSTDAVLALRWQMADLLTVFNADDVPQSSVTSGSVVIVQSYTLPTLAQARVRAPQIARSPAPALGASKKN